MKHPRTWLYIEKSKTTSQPVRVGNQSEEGKKGVRQAGWNVDWVGIEIYAVTK